MFCDRCGTPLNAGAQFCPSCGKPVVPGSVGPRVSAVPMAAGVVASSEGRVQRHIQLLAGLWLANGILRMVEVGWMLLVGRLFWPSVRGWMGPGNWPYVSGRGLDSLISSSLYSAGIFLAAFGVLHFVLAWGLFERQPWARVLGLVIGFLALLRIPFGTALGIYTIWVLLPENSAREYERLARA